MRRSEEKDVERETSGYTSVVDETPSKGRPVVTLTCRDSTGEERESFSSRSAGLLLVVGLW